MRLNVLKSIALGALFAALLTLPAVGPYAQTRPTQNPTYIPTGQMASQSLTAASTATNPYYVQGEGTVAIQLGGTNTGVSAAIQVTNAPASVVDASATWTTVQSAGGSGLFRVSANGVTRVRVFLTAISSGTLTVIQSGAPGFAGENVDLGSVLTQTLQTTGTVNSADFVNYDGGGLVCTYNATNESGSASVKFEIQEKDAASGTYQALLTSETLTTLPNSFTAGAGTTKLAVFPGIQTTSLPTHVAGLSWHLGRVWRVAVTVGGTSTPAITSTVGCNVLH